MKNIIIILTLILVTTSLFGQEEIFKQKRDKNQLSLEMQNKINLFTNGNMNKATEIITIKKGLNFKEGYKGVFNIFNKKIEFKIFKKKDDLSSKTQIYDAELKDGGTAVIVNSPEGLSSTVWYKDEVYSIEYLDNENYLVMQKDMVEINKRENRDEIGLNKEMLNYDNELFTTNNRSTVKPKIRILVVYTSEVQNLNVSNLIIRCRDRTNEVFLTAESMQK